MKLAILGVGAVLAAPVAWSGTYLDADWAAKVCDAWNKSETLTSKLAGDWMANDGDRGYKTIRIYRDECGSDSAVELTISSSKDGKLAECVYGGKPTDKDLDGSMDYLMHATYADWQCMGRGDWGCGAMGAMMSGKLKFEGPKMEAMSVMAPFDAFLQLMDDIPGDADRCPTLPAKESEAKAE